MSRNVKRGGCLVAVLAVFAACVIAGGVWSRFGGFGTGPSADADEFARYAAEVSSIEIPAGTRVVALGEATHGNREFQELKLDVFKVLVERHGVRAFALEADAGGCELVNRYIHGGEGTLEEAVGNLDFSLYRTDQMAELISWMRAYNETAAPGDDLRFYGFDLQSYEHSHQLLLEKMRARGLDTAGLESLGQLRDEHPDGLDRNLVKTTYEAARQQLEALPEDEDTRLALHLVECLLQNDELGRAANSPDGYGLRDRFMAENALWILEQEEQRGNPCILVSAHNGHIEQTGAYGPDAKVMGNLLADELGGAYYAIGTDFFRAEVNLPKGDGRMTHTFYSHDPLAHAAATCGYERCWLDFARVPDSSPLRVCIDGPIMMGSVGEGFSPLMYVLPQTYRVKREPSSPYDSMIFVPYAHPTGIWPRSVQNS
ncbi:MAG: erythromycin esterase family protein [Atopobiaceae bacterium]|nr:erythromycin esterase family protein [Atopobiaceae bacterium]